MPLYEYACRRCAHRFEQRLNYEQRLEPQSCPACGARETSLCLSVPARVGNGARPAAADTGGCAGGSCTCGRFPATA
jgi:putative FmdB family regulatory protein